MYGPRPLCFAILLPPAALAGLGGQGEQGLAFFAFSVVVIEYRREMWFAWPWAERIARAGQVTRAAAIIADLVSNRGMR